MKRNVPDHLWHRIERTITQAPMPLYARFNTGTKVGLALAVAACVVISITSINAHYTQQRLEAHRYVEALYMELHDPEPAQEAPMDILIDELLNSPLV